MGSDPVDLLFGLIIQVIHIISYILSGDCAVSILKLVVTFRTESFSVSVKSEYFEIIKPLK